MIATAAIQSLAQVGDRVEIDTDKTRIDGFLEKVEMDGIVVSWRTVHLALMNGKQTEIMLTTSIFVPNEEMRSFAVIK